MMPETFSWGLQQFSGSKLAAPVCLVSSTTTMHPLSRYKKLIKPNDYQVFCWERQCFGFPDVSAFLFLEDFHFLLKYSKLSLEE